MHEIIVRVHSEVYSLLRIESEFSRKLIDAFLFRFNVLKLDLKLYLI